jgi:general secretion pathway protein G
MGSVSDIRETLLRTPRQSRARGFTILEWSIAIAILGILVAIAIPAYEEYIERTRVARAVIDIASIGAKVSNYEVDNRELPASLHDVGLGSMRDPWGNLYQYVNHDDKASRGKWRRDKNIVPINTDFDVFSMGKDGDSRPPLTAKASRDDIVRANNGRFTGLASEYDP